jgi:hypothetical protein
MFATRGKSENPVWTKPNERKLVSVVPAWFPAAMSVGLARSLSPEPNMYWIRKDGSIGPGNW